MRAVVQRVRHARVSAAGYLPATIDHGLLVFAANERDDTQATYAWTARKLATLRLFPDADGRLRRNIVETGGAVLLVPNFTVAGRIAKGTSPDFSRAAPRAEAAAAFDALVDAVAATEVPVRTGFFGADMTIEAAHDGPVTMVVERRQV